ncbi:hypothetical protein FHT28_006538 [Rhizobium sp. SG570]|jgi:hypothetical protein|nr:hypothetical protein [Rhizobium sp. SG741]NKJ39778.1 hypothetical protein [Rhizobium sp. SG570]
MLAKLVSAFTQEADLEFTIACKQEASPFAMPFLGKSAKARNGLLFPLVAFRFPF